MLMGGVKIDPRNLLAFWPRGSIVDGKLQAKYPNASHVTQQVKGRGFAGAGSAPCLGLTTAHTFTADGPSDPTCTVNGTLTFPGADCWNVRAYLDGVLWAFWPGINVGQATELDASGNGHHLTGLVGTAITERLDGSGTNYANEAGFDLGENLIVNSRCVGVGIGTLPTGWSVKNLVGITVSSASATVGQCDARFSGTASAAAYPVIRPMLDTYLPATTGDSFVGRVHIVRISGTLPTQGVWVRLLERDAAGALLATRAEIAYVRDGYVYISGVCQHASCAKIEFNITPFITNGSTVDFVLRLSKFQLEKSTTLGSYIETSGMAISGRLPFGTISDESISIGLFSDSHYSADGGFGANQAVNIPAIFTRFDALTVDAVIGLGDTFHGDDWTDQAEADADVATFDAWFAALDTPYKKIATGNHDHPELFNLWGVSNYCVENDTMDVGGYRIIIIHNAVNPSFYASAATVSWFSSTLSDAQAAGKKVVICAHARFDQDPTEGVYHFAVNAAELRGIVNAAIDAGLDVRAVFQGHTHIFDIALNVDGKGVNYYTIDSCASAQTAYMATIDDMGITLTAIASAVPFDQSEGLPGPLGIDAPITGTTITAPLGPEFQAISTFTGGAEVDLATFEKTNQVRTGPLGTIVRSVESDAATIARDDRVVGA